MASYKKHIIIVGSARSGTSWLCETIAKQFRYRLLFEPEHDTQTKHGWLISDMLITSKTGFEKAIWYLNRVFKNKVDSKWIAQNSNRKFKMHLWPFIPKKYIIKFVRCNLSAAWMHAHFGIPVIHIIRNPYDVIASQQRVKFPWLYNLDRFRDQPHLVALIKKEYHFDIQSTSNISEVEILALRWCIENIIALQILKKDTDTYTVVRHEDLRSNMDAFLELCQKYHLDPIPNLEKEYKKPSSKTHPKSAILGAKDAETKFTEEELEKINGILDIFKMTLYQKYP